MVNRVAGQTVASVLRKQSTMMSTSFLSAISGGAMIAQSPVVFSSRSAGKTPAVVLIVATVLCFTYLVTYVDRAAPGTDAHRDYDWSTS